LTVQGAAAAQHAAGFHAATGDQLALTQSIVDYLNSHGGFGARKIELVSSQLQHVRHSGRGPWACDTHGKLLRLGWPHAPSERAHALLRSLQREM
jgi:hypothetical protein